MIYTLPTVEQGDDFKGYSMKFNIPLTGLIIDLKVFYPNKKDIMTIMSVPEFLEIDPADNTRLSIKRFRVDFEPNVYYCKLKMNPQGVRRTIMEFTWTVNG
jgi:hypothetical protein